MSNYYSKRLIREFLEAKNVGEIQEADLVVELANPVCTSDSPPSPCQLKVFFKLDGFRVKDVKFKVQGCVPAVAFLSLFTERLKGKDLRSVYQELPKQAILEELGGIPAGKLSCPIIGLTLVDLALQKISSSE